jgi:hypothetical protein
LAKNYIGYNPALGSGQLQVRDIHYVSKEIRSTWDFCKVLDEKCIAPARDFQNGCVMPFKITGLRTNYENRNTPR